MLVLKRIIFYLLLILQHGCNGQTTIKNVEAIIVDEKDATKIIASTDTSLKTIHVFVALCDNKFQGIVPVPSKIGNGQDPDNNLYWGCAFGIRTFFRKSAEWKQVKFQKLDSLKLERIVFKHATKNWYLIAEAYNGKYIDNCTKNNLKAAEKFRAWARLN
jgi:hypothetical protein